MLVDFFVGLQTAIAARGYTGPVRLGQRYIAGQDSATVGRVVCVLGRDAVVPTTRIGGNPRARLTRMGALSVHVWGPAAYAPGGNLDNVQSLRNAEALVNLVINAARDVATGTLQVTSVDWAVNEETPTMKAGYVGTIELAVEVPVVDTLWPTSPTGGDAPKPSSANSFAPPVGQATAVGPTCG